MKSSEMAESRRNRRNNPLENFNLIECRYIQQPHIPVHISVACHPFTQVTTCKDGINIHRSAEYKVTDASSQHHSKDQISLREASADNREE